MALLLPPPYANHPKQYKVLEQHLFLPLTFGPADTCRRCWKWCTSAFHTILLFPRACTDKVPWGPSLHLHLTL